MTQAQHTKAAVFKAACIQVNATNDMAVNIAAASKLTREAVAAGANFVLMPENVSMMEWGRDNITAKAMAESDHAALKAFRALAQELRTWLHCGSLALRLPDGTLANRTYVITPDGNVAAKYDKIHM
ncbi:MAG: nitrilase-related carbon-nitrogen hydrolase, partial [Prosthecobacter sp.]|nr:nitrilase-related carbon-nitrogen hydrolase [Prosthecobacter sp.]